VSVYLLSVVSLVVTTLLSNSIFVFDLRFGLSLKFVLKWHLVHQNLSYVKPFGDKTMFMRMNFLRRQTGGKLVGQGCPENVYVSKVYMFSCLPKIGSKQE
jgi:hypothetical protein